MGFIKHFQDDTPCNWTPKVEELMPIKLKYIELIGKMRHDGYTYTGRFPDNVMIHPSLKRRIFNEVKELCAVAFHNPKSEKIFGMKVIWTKAIDENTVICTFNAIKV